MNCCICFDETDFYTCILCKEMVTCKECCENFIENSDSLIICPKENCNQAYIFKKNIIDNYNKYVDLVFKFLQNDNIKTLTVMKYNQSLVNKIRNERLEFLNSIKSPAILAFINVALQEKLKKIEKKNFKFIKIIENDTVSCYNTLCDRGTLNENLKCNDCSVTFCKECKEKKLKNHKCDENILKSLKLMENFTKCPKCFVLVEKKDGCNAITCAVCKTNFDYLSGNFSKFGNHGQSIYFDLKRTYRLSTEYAKSYDKNIINLLHDIEILKPDRINFDKIIKYCNKLLNKTETNKEKLCKMYYNYNIQNKEIIEYFNSIQQIEEHNKNKTLTLEILEEIKSNLN